MTSNTMMDYILHTVRQEIALVKLVGQAGKEPFRAGLVLCVYVLLSLHPVTYVRCDASRSWVVLYFRGCHVDADIGGDVFRPVSGGRVYTYICTTSFEVVVEKGQSNSQGRGATGPIEARTP